MCAEADIYILSWDKRDVKHKDPETGLETETELATWAEEIFHGIPTEAQMREVVNRYYNQVTDRRILEGFRWNGVPVWLSTENQFNYKATHDLAVQTGGATLPVTFKLGTDEEPSYVTFNTVDEISAFYTAALAYIQECYTDGWKQKDAFDAQQAAGMIVQLKKEGGV